MTSRDPIHLLSERLAAIQSLTADLVAQLPLLDQKANGWQAVTLYERCNRAGYLLESVRDFSDYVLAQEMKK